MSEWKQYETKETNPDVKGAIKRRVIENFKNQVIDDGIYECKKCGNHGYTIVWNEFDEMMYQKCTCYNIRNARRKMKDMGLLRYLDKHSTFANFKATADWQKRIKEKAMEFVNDFKGKTFYIGGQVGAGKTILCSTILCNIMKDNEICGYDYMIWGDLVRCLAFDDKDKREMQFYKDCDILYIDDFLRSSARNDLSLQSWERDVAMELINYRYINKKTTIISSELYYQELEKIDDAIATRIYENADFGKYCLSIKRDEKRNLRKNKDELI